MEINPVKGTHDIIGEEADVYFNLEMAARMLADIFGYKEMRTPIIEHSPLFVRSVGESSDIVTKEMYTFLDKGNREITLRPEMTAGVMRSIVSNKLYATNDLPLKYFYFGPCFRYERPQAGRYRQFHQFGIEQVGVKNEYEDAEVVLLGKRFLEIIGLQNVKVLINTLGDQQSRDDYRIALKEYFAKHIDNMCEDCKRRLEINPLRILDCKVPEDQEIIKNAPKMKDYLSVEAKVYFEKVISILQNVGVTVEQDDTLVRGLDYYTGIVFEYHDINDEIGALGGGGHYKNLLKEIGGPDLEGVGLSFGEERLYYVIKKILGDDIPSNGLDYYVMGMTEEAINTNFDLKDKIRSLGLSADGNNEIKSFKALFKIATRKKAKFAIIIGDDELKDKKLTVKNLKSQEQTTISLEDAERMLPSMIEEYNNNEGE
ncbi:MAG TPA: histidine--tRNA ligase [Firmicutes bacterium]|nr:histidine--tRNA ligase [Bacillota bacterium]